MLKNHLLAFLQLSFEWGKADCFLFVAQWLDLKTGTSFYKDFSGQYQNENEARALIYQNFNSSSFEKVALKTLKKTGLTVQMHTASDGDIGMIATNRGFSPAIYYRGLFYAKTGNGLYAVKHARKVWGCDYA